MFDVLVYALLRKYIKDSLVGAGALKGASCQIQSIVRNETDDANIVTYKWEDNNGVSHTSQMIVHDGAIPTVDVGTVKTVSYNKPAKVIPKETETGVELDFEIPQGEPGEGGGEATNIFVGTMDEWNALTVSEKEQYTVVNITDDEQYVFTSKFLEKTTTMPLPSADNLSQHRLYVGDTTAQYIKGAIYECQVVAGTDPVQYKWEPISSADVDVATPAKAGVVKPDDDTIKIDADGTIRAEGVREFVGTIEEWEALSAAEKAKYGIVVIDDAEEQVVFGSAAFKGATDIVRPNNHNLVESNAVYSAIANAISSAFEPHGSITVAELTPSLLTTENLGNVYTISDSGVTNEYFLQGANVPISAKDGVSIVKAGADTILFNLSPGIFDLSALQSKSLTQSIAGESTVEGTLGALSTNKADKVSSATAGDIAGLDANGNLTDSGKKASDFATAANLANYINENGAINQFDITLSNTKSVNTGGDWSDNAFTYRGLTYTVNDDNIVITGTPTDNSFLYLLAKNIPADRYMFGGLKDAENIVWDGGFWIYNGSVETAISTGAAGNKNDFTVDLSSYTFDRIKFGIKRKYNTLTNDTVKLFIRKADINIDVNAPYAKTNRELTKELTVETGEITRLVSFSALTAYGVRKYGRIVEIYFAGTLSEAVNIWTDFLTVPEGFRPSHYVQIASFNTYSGCKNLQLAPSGGIQSGSSLASNDYIRFTTTYII